jgi:Zn-dependent peptidase ImmA (M78 family)
VSLPFNIVRTTKTLHNVRIITYRDFAKRYSLPLIDVVRGTESNDGATHYDKKANQYIILYNDETNYGRQRFTVAHELGHILLDHLVTLATHKAASNNMLNTSNIIIEKEADWFAGTILCPFPVLRKLKINSPAQIKKLCAISTQASLIKYKQYTKWCKYHRKTAWESDITRLFVTYIKNHETF